MERPSLDLHFGGSAVAGGALDGPLHGWLSGGGCVVAVLVVDWNAGPLIAVDHVDASDDALSRVACVVLKSCWISKLDGNMIE